MHAPAAGLQPSVVAYMYGSGRHVNPYDQNNQQQLRSITQGSDRVHLNRLVWVHGVNSMGRMVVLSADADIGLKRAVSSKLACGHPL